MSKHTPGPWSVGSNSGHIETANAWRMSIAICYNKDSKADGVSKEEFKANAQLIAAAPELLEALKEARSILATAEDVSEHLSIKKIDAAIAKATGQNEV